MKRCLSAQSGFTLIETVLYLALYALLMAGVMSAAYAFSEGSERAQTSAFLTEEGTFLIGKIDWTLAGAVSLQQPIATGSQLQITRSDGRAIIMRAHGSDIRLQIGAASEQSLNSSAFSVANLIFAKTAEPQGVSASFTLLATTSDGRRVSGDFYTFVDFAL